MAPELPEGGQVPPQSAGHARPNKPWRWWLEHSRTWKHDERAPFRPCSHTGKCKNNPNCSCFQQGISCEKSCNCPSACTRRFRGCTCHAMNKACIDEKSCDCKALNRECDPDLCVTCGSHEVLDPANRYNDKVVKTKCGNVSIQRAVPRRTQIGQSALLSAGGVVGWGLFMGEEVRKGEYIGEYIGEVVTPEESEQRGIIYNAMNLSYLFDLNSKQVLDSTPIGNKLRYINHQGEDFANCQAKVMFCGGVQRIGMFAVKNIGLGEELLFNYGEGFASKIDMVKMRKDGTVTTEKAKKGVEANTKTSAHKKLPQDIGKRPKLHLKGPKRKGKLGLDLETMDGVLEDDDAMDLDVQDVSSDEDGIVTGDEDDDEEVFEVHRPKTKGPTRKIPMSHSERMQKAWVSRYRNQGMIAEAEEQQRKLDELQMAREAEAREVEKRGGKKRARRQSL